MLLPPLLNDLISDAHRHLPVDPEELKVCRMFICATQIHEFEKVLKVAKLPSHLPFLGLHPWYITQAPEDWEKRLRQALEANPHAQIGECGLDKCPSALAKCPFEKQLDVFRKQVKLAVEFRRVLNIHTVRTLREVYQILKEEVGEFHQPGIILHSFSAPSHEVAKFVRLNCFFSIGKRFRFDSKKAPKTLARIMDKIVLESDSPSDEVPFEGMSPDSGQYSLELIYAIALKISAILDNKDPISILGKALENFTQLSQCGDHPSNQNILK